MQGSEGPLPGKSEEIEKVSLIAPVFVGSHMFEEQRGSFEALDDFEMVIPHIFVRRNIFRSDPWGFQKLDGVRQFSIEAEVTGILEITVFLLFLLS
jgi:hypothetical protein